MVFLEECVALEEGVVLVPYFSGVIVAEVVGMVYDFMLVQR